MNVKMKGADKIVWIVVALVLVVIFLAIFVPILLGGGKWGFSTIQKMIGDWLNFQSPEEKTLLKAVVCAYFRCIEGCGSGKVKQANWEDENGEKVSCLDNFCKDEWRNGEGKICGDVAKENPVKVYLDSSVTITEEHWKIFFEGNIIYQPFVTQTNCEPFGLHVGTSTQGLILPAELKCEFDQNIATDFVKKVKSCELPDGYYNIWSGKGSGWDAEDIIICSAK